MQIVRRRLPVLLFAAAVIVVPTSTGRADDALVDLARQRFGDLSPAEERLFAAVAAGQICDLREGDDEHDKPADGQGWPASRALKMERVAWLCTARDAMALVTVRGVRIAGARIENDADSLGLTGLDAPFAIALTHCYFGEPLRVGNSTFRSLDLSHSHLAQGLEGDDLELGKSLTAAGATVIGNVHLRRLRANGNVDLSGSRIEGSVQLPTAQIGGGLRCSRAAFLPPTAEGDTEPPIALNLDLARIGGTASLDGDDAVGERFQCRGTARFVLANIRGNLDMWYADFDCGGKDDAKDALYCNGLKVGGSVFLAHGFTCRGKISFRTGDIGHYFNLYELAAEPKPALGNAWLDLQACRVGTVNCDTLDWVAPGRLLLNGFEYNRFEVVKQQGTVETQLPLTRADFLHWLKLQESEPFFPQSYEHLAEVLRREGYEDKARHILIQKERELGSRAGWGLRDIAWFRIFGPMIGYGHNPLYGLWWLLAVWILGAVVFEAANRRGLMEEVRERWSSEAAPHPSGAPPKTETVGPQPLIYSLDVMIPLIDLGQSTRWRPCRTRPWGEALQWFHWCLTLVGWTLTTLLVAGLTGLVQR